MANWDVTTAGGSLEFDPSQGQHHDLVKIDANHFLDVYQGASIDGFAQVLTVNTSTWAVTTDSARFEFDISNNLYNSVVRVDTTHYINFWTGPATDGFVQVLAVNTSTWAVTTAAAALEFETSAAEFNAAVAIDDNHFINFFRGSGGGTAQVFTVNTSTWAVTTAAATLLFDASGFSTGQAAVKIDANHFLNFWSGLTATNVSDGVAQVFTVNTSTWAVTTAAAKLNFDTSNLVDYNRCIAIDSTHFLNVWQGGTNEDLHAQVFAVNTSTWAVTTAGAKLDIDTDNFAGPYGPNSIEQINSNHFLVLWEGGSTGGFDGFAQVLEVNTSTWAVSLPGSKLEFDTSDATYQAAVKIDTSHYLITWGGVLADGFAQVLAVDVPVTATGKGIPFDRKMRRNVLLRR